MCIATSWSDRFVTAKYRSTLVAVLICLSHSALAASSGQGPAAQLPKLLEQQGWQHQSDGDGNIYLHPPQSASAAERPQGAITQDVRPPDVERLLLDYGWRIEADAHGDMLLLPVSPPAPADIDQMLRERGWRILTDVDGNTLLMPTASSAIEPAGPTNVRQPQPVEPAPPDAGQPQASEPAAQFRRALEEKGWIVSTESDGSMVIYPPASARQEPMPHEGHNITGNGYCEGITLIGEEFDHPVDSEEKAKLLAGAWIAHFGQAAYVVGQAEKVDRVFFVSIVDSAPPHTLRNQLVVRADGTIVALY